MPTFAHSCSIKWGSKMRKAYLIGLFWLSLTILLLVAQARPSEPIAQPCRATPQPQCVRVVVDDGGGRGSLGTGAYIAPKLVATCWHVVQDRRADDAVIIRFPQPITISIPGGTTIQQIEWKNIRGTVRVSKKNMELALIELDELPDCEPLKFCTRLDFGQPLSIQGYGGGKYKQLWGRLYEKMLAPGPNADYIWYQIEGAEAVSGDSGGPVLDEQGRYTGTLWGANNGKTGFLDSVKVMREAMEAGFDIPNFHVPPVDFHIYSPKGPQ